MKPPRAPCPFPPKQTKGRIECALFPSAGIKHDIVTVKKIINRVSKYPRLVYADMMPDNWKPCYGQPNVEELEKERQEKRVTCVGEGE